jgi:hypothetical protein
VQGNLTVALNSTTTGSTIYYTFSTDGSTPATPTTTSSSVQAGENVTLAVPTGTCIRIYAFAAKSGMTDSAVMTSYSYSTCGHKITDVVELGSLSGSSLQFQITSVDGLLHSITVSAGASAKVYSDSSCATEVAGGEPIKNGYVVKVTASDNSGYTIYNIELVTPRPAEIVLNNTGSMDNNPGVIYSTNLYPNANAITASPQDILNVSITAQEGTAAIYTYTISGTGSFDPNSGKYTVGSGDTTEPISVVVTGKETGKLDWTYTYTVTLPPPSVPNGP